METPALVQEGKDRCGQSTRVNNTETLKETLKVSTLR